VVAHELRSPLTAVDAYLSVLEEEYVKDREKQREIIKRSKKRIGALLDLVSDLLNIASIEAGTVSREIAPQSIGGILSEVRDLMEPLAKQNLIRLHLQVMDGLPDVQGDREELTRLFNNLLSNAIKYNKKDGEVSITAEQDGAYVKISVADTGIGITKDGLSRLFSEFFREKRDETRLVTGSGLGLHMVKSIVDFYHGRIEVQSEVRKGSTFTDAQALFYHNLGFESAPHVNTGCANFTRAEYNDFITNQVAEFHVRVVPVWVKESGSPVPGEEGLGLGRDAPTGCLQPGQRVGAALPIPGPDDIRQLDAQARGRFDPGVLAEGGRDPFESGGLPGSRGLVDPLVVPGVDPAAGVLKHRPQAEE